MHPEKFKRIVTILLNVIKELETELVAHRMIVLAASRVDDMPDLGLLLQLAKPLAAQGMDQKYDDMKEKLLHIIDQGVFDQEVEEFLKSWKPEGPTH
jgi:hypothetical protein